jgi:subtilisin family serine protease
MAVAAWLAGVPAASVAVEHATPSGPLALVAPARPVKGASQVYLVKLREAAALNYRGEKAGFAATKPAPGRKFQSDSATVESYVKYLEDTHDRLLTNAGAAGAKIYSYRYALNGFAARLAPGQVSRLQQSGLVERIWVDTDQRVQTNNSAIFLGLEDQDGGLRADLGLRGEGVIIAVIDSGVAPNHPSLADTEELIPSGCTSRWSETSWLGIFLCHAIRKNPPTQLMFDPPQGFTGICQTGEGFEASHCNNKLVGARYYLNGFLSRNELDPGEFISPRDAEGHGTHLASIAAGNSVTAELFGTRLGRISGIAPRARIAVYKACWLEPGRTRATCATSDLARAIDDAVADGVDIINYSVGNLEIELNAPDDLALLNAFDAGVFTSVAAGNDGPNPGTIGSPSGAPWVLTVAASTQTGNRFEEAIEVTAPESLAQLLSMKEASFTPELRGADPIEGELRLVDDGQDFLVDGSPGSPRDACEALENGDELTGRIALLERGGCDFQVKLARVEDAGAIAAVVYNNVGEPIIMNGAANSVQIPAVMIGTADGQLLVDELTAEVLIRLQLSKGVFRELSDPGNRIGSFSSRGPSPGELDFLKPDVTAPGVHILAAHTADPANTLKGELYQYLSGTSMAAPEAAGVAALLKEAHPDWSPARLKSSLSTSAYRQVLKQDGVGAADPFDTGSGHIDANRAIDPGLVYDTQFFDFAAYLCGLEDPPYPATDCAILAAAGFSAEGRDLNLPSVGVAELISGDVVTRRVTNVGPASRYSLELTPPLGIDVSVQPPSLSLNSGETAEFSITFQRNGAVLDTWAFGRLVWSDGARSAASPIALRPVTLRAPEELRLSGSSGDGSLPVAFGYSGTYIPDVHGLRAPLILDCLDDSNQPVPCLVPDDPTNEFSFRFDNGVNAHYIDVPPGQLYARFSLFDQLTDGNDDLDLYLFYCPNDQCTQVAESGTFTSEEEINLFLPTPGLYAALVHGFETDQIIGGPGARYTLFAWSFGVNDDVGNLLVTAPGAVTDGDRLNLGLRWAELGPATRYLGAISHNTPLGLYGFTILQVDSP